MKMKTSRNTVDKNIANIFLFILRFFLFLVFFVEFKKLHFMISWQTTFEFE